MDQVLTPVLTPADKVWAEKKAPYPLFTVHSNGDSGIPGDNDARIKRLRRDDRYRLLKQIVFSITHHPENRKTGITLAAGRLLSAIWASFFLYSRHIPHRSVSR